MSDGRKSGNDVNALQPEAAVRKLCLPDWPSNVQLFTTHRRGGVSKPPYDSLNLAFHVGDDADLVRENRRRLAAFLPRDTDLAWLKQVHGNRVVQAKAGRGETPEADALWTRTPKLGCSIMTADCLPVLFSDYKGRIVAAAHAGWRGLAAGVLENTVSALPVPAPDLLAWIGPAIGFDAFEVGAEVREALLVSHGTSAASAQACFKPSPGRSGAYLTDLPGLARLRLRKLGLGSVHSDHECTFAAPESFFSYRRDGDTGRMVSLILRLCTDQGP